MALDRYKDLLKELMDKKDDFQLLNTNYVYAESIGALYQWFFNYAKRPSPKLWTTFWEYVYELKSMDYDITAELNEMHKLWLSTFKSLHQRAKHQDYCTNLKARLEKNFMPSVQ